MTTKQTITVVLILIALSLVAGLSLWNRLPDPMPSHWGVNDQVNGTTPKVWGVFLMPLIAIGISALLLLIPSIDPLKANIAQFRSTFNIFIVVIVAFMLSVYALTLLWSLGYHAFRMSAVLLPFVGVLFIFVGYMLRKAKRNFFIGIRTPWTLSSDSVWDKTHQLGSVLFMVCGVLTFIGGMFGSVTGFLLTFVPLMGSTIFLVVYSYILYRGETKA